MLDNVKLKNKVNCLFRGSSIVNNYFLTLPHEISSISSHETRTIIVSLSKILMEHSTLSLHRNLL